MPSPLSIISGFLGKGPWSDLIFTAIGALPAFEVSIVNFVGTPGRHFVESNPGPYALTKLEFTSKSTFTYKLKHLNVVHFECHFQFTLKGDPGICCSANLIVTSYSPGSVGIYSTEHEPSRLSLQVIFASDGPSIAKPKPPVPAPAKDIK